MFVVRGWALRTVLVAREVIEQTPIKATQLGTLKHIENRPQEWVQEGGRIVNGLEWTLQEVRNPLLGEDESETSKVVALEQILSVQDATREILNLDARERVEFFGVSAIFRVSGYTSYPMPTSAATSASP